jgi:hypothetical protein
MLYRLHERGGVGWEGGEGAEGGGSKMLGNRSPSYVPQGDDPVPPLPLRVARQV